MGQTPNAAATAGRPAVPKNITLILLPLRAPELNPVENTWQYLRHTWLSNRAPASIGSREWVLTGQSEGRWY